MIRFRINNPAVLIGIVNGFGVDSSMEGVGVMPEWGVRVLGQLPSQRRRRTVEENVSDTEDHGVCRTEYWNMNEKR